MRGISTSSVSTSGLVLLDLFARHERIGRRADDFHVGLAA